MTRQNHTWASPKAQRYYERHRDEIIASHRGRPANRAKANEYARTWYRLRVKNVEFRQRLRRQWLEYYYRNRERTRDRRTAHDHNRRAAGYLTQADVAYVIERSRGLCGICGRMVRKADRSIDHIVPISMGGDNDLRNLQLTHLVCNMRRQAARIPAQMIMLA